MLTPRFRRICIAAAAPALSLSLIGCSGTDGNTGETCEGPKFVYNPPAPAYFQEAFPPKNDGTDSRGTKEHTPYEINFQLNSQCEKDVEIQNWCLLGDSQDLEHFTLEEPSNTTFSREESSVVRLTYSRETPNQGDDADAVALVLQTNATNLPTLVAPICTRVIEKTEDATRKTVECESPVEVVEPGTKKEGLCEEGGGS